MLAARPVRTRSPGCRARAAQESTSRACTSHYAIAMTYGSRSTWAPRPPSASSTRPRGRPRQPGHGPCYVVTTAAQRECPRAPRSRPGFDGVGPCDRAEEQRRYRGQGQCARAGGDLGSLVGSREVGQRGIEERSVRASGSPRAPTRQPPRRYNIEGLDARLRNVEAGFGRIDQRLETLERVMLPRSDPAGATALKSRNGATAREPISSNGLRAAIRAMRHLVPW